MGHLRNQLKDITFDNITPGNIQTVGGRVYADSKSKTDVDDLVNIQNAWSVVHAPTYGQPIPSTGTLETVTSSEGVPIKILAPTANTVYRVSGFFVKNESLASKTFTGYITDLLSTVPVTALAATIGAGLTVFVPLVSAIPLMVDANVTVFGEVNADDFEMGVVAIKVVQ